MRLKIVHSLGGSRVALDVGPSTRSNRSLLGGFSAAVVCAIAIGGPVEPPKVVPVHAPAIVHVEAPAVMEADSLPAIGEELPPMDSPEFETRMRALGVDPADVARFKDLHESMR